MGQISQYETIQTRIEDLSKYFQMMRHARLFFINYVGLMVLSADLAIQLQRHGIKVEAGWYALFVDIKHRLLLEQYSIRLEHH